MLHCAFGPYDYSAGPAHLEGRLPPPARCRSRALTRRWQPRCRPSDGSPTPLRSSPSCSSSPANPNPLTRPRSSSLSSSPPRPQVATAPTVDPACSVDLELRRDVEKLRRPPLRRLSPAVGADGLGIGRIEPATSSRTPANSGQPRPRCRY